MNTPPLFEPYQAFGYDDCPLEPMCASSSIDWNLISSIDPDLLGIDKVSKKFRRLLKELPYYTASKADSGIFTHPLTIRVFKLFQCSVNYYQNKVKKLTRQINNKKAVMKSMEITHQNGLIELTNCESRIRITESFEKCYACKQRFKSIESLDSHMKFHHKNLYNEWSRIRNNDQSDPNVEKIVDLKAQIEEMKTKMMEQEKEFTRKLYSVETTYKARQKIHEKYQTIPTTKISYVEINPPYPPYHKEVNPNIEIVHTFIDDENTVSKIGNSDNSEMVEIKNGLKKNIKKQAAIVSKKKQKRKFNMIREQLRIQLEEEIPMPQPLLSSSCGENSEIYQHNPPKRLTDTDEEPSLPNFYIPESDDTTEDVVNTTTSVSSLSRTSQNIPAPKQVFTIVPDSDVSYENELESFESFE